MNKKQKTWIEKIKEDIIKGELNAFNEGIRSCKAFMREDILTILDFVERYNKQDKEKDVAESADKLKKMIID